MTGYDITPELHPAVRLPDGLELRATVDPDNSLLDTFFAGYDRAFVLPNEKEEIDGFRDCLALNLPPAYVPLAERYGPFREFVAVAVDTGLVPEAVVGGANFICYLLTSEAGKPVLAMNLNYIFVLPEHRRQGYLGRILDACEQLARQAFRSKDGSSESGAIPLLIFMELNDPLRLGPAEYALDTGHSGLDQLQRIRIWASKGARIIDFPYVQPPLAEAQAADHNLLLAVLGADGTGLSACLLRDHLSRFFAISVLKGGTKQREGEADAQLKILDRQCREEWSLDLLDPMPWLDRHKLAPGEPLSAGWGSLREAIRPVPSRTDTS